MSARVDNRCAEVLRDSDVDEEEFEKVSRRFLRQLDRRPGFTFFSFGTVTRETRLTVGHFGNSMAQTPIPWRQLEA